MRILLVVYDNESYIPWFPQGLAYIASVLLKAGHEVVIYNQDVNHYPSEHLTQYLNQNHFDVVGVGVIAGYFQYRQLLKVSGAINASSDRPVYIIGGHGPSPEPEFFLRKTKADIIVLGEGEETIVEVAEAIQRQSSLENIKGIAFRRGDQTVVNPRRPLIKEVDSIPWPAYQLFPIECYRLTRGPHATNTDFILPILSGRGCTFRCNFCYRMDRGFRPRSPQSIVDEIKFLKEKYRITYVYFSDELLMSSAQRTKNICQTFIDQKLKIRWYCNGRLNYAAPDVLRLMKEAGCVLINYGIEAVDDQILKNMNKQLTVRQINSGIEETLKVGISPGYNIIFGNIGETKKTLEKGVQFLLKYDDGAQMRTIRPVTPYPGSDLYYYAIRKGLLKDVEDFYENKHLNSDLVAVNFTDMTDDEFHAALFDANRRLLENYFKKKLESVVQQSRDLYCGKDVSFRGFRQL